MSEDYNEKKAFYEGKAKLLNELLQKIELATLGDNELLSELVGKANWSANFLDLINPTTTIKLSKVHEDDDERPSGSAFENIPEGEYKRLSGIALANINREDIRSKVNEVKNNVEKYEYIIKLLDANQTGGGRNIKSRRSKQRRKKQTKRRKYRK